jgi:hypothetical protein
LTIISKPKKKLRIQSIFTDFFWIFPDTTSELRTPHKQNPEYRSFTSPSTTLLLRTE